MCFFMLQTFYDAFPHTIHSCHESALTWFHLMCCHRSCNTYAWLRTSRFLRKLSWGWAPKVISFRYPHQHHDQHHDCHHYHHHHDWFCSLQVSHHYKWWGEPIWSSWSHISKAWAERFFCCTFFCNLRFLNTHIQVDKGGEDRVGICLLKSLSRDELPEDLSTIRFPVRSLYIHNIIIQNFIFISPSIRLQKEATTSRPRWSDLHCGASLLLCVTSVRRWTRQGSTR